MAISGEEMMKVKERVCVSRKTKIKNDGGEAATGEEEEEDNNVVLRWEKFLPKMDMTVLLVEADDSTRHIITALLTKCSYKVAAFSDGSKAWEALNGVSHNIDLILTEVEVPSISGFSLLSLVTEHEVCRNIPVIMMSAHDSVSTVYNCMLKGAADFLVKPIRKNELNNLWQHVWRRQALSSQVQVATDTRQMVEVTADRDSYKNCSDDHEARCIQRNGASAAKESEAQSSCRLQDSQATEACLEHKDAITQPEQRKSPSDDITTQKDEHERGSERAMMYDGEAQGSTSIPKTKSDILMLTEESMDADRQCLQTNITAAAFDYDNNFVHNNSSREAIDLIGRFNTYTECRYRSLDWTYALDKHDSSLLLELSLKLSDPRGSLDQVMDDRHMLKQSDASAFSRYNSTTLQPLYTAPQSTCDRNRGYKCSFDIQLTLQAHEHSSDNSHPIGNDDNNTKSSPSNQLEVQFPCSQQVVPAIVPVKSAKFELLSNAYNNLMPQSPLPSPVSADNHEHPIQVYKNCTVDPGIGSFQESVQYMMDQNIASAQLKHRKSYDLEPKKDQTHLSSVSDQHGGGDFSNDISNHFNSRSNGSGNAVQCVKVAAENGKESNLIHDEKFQRSIQREAALAKFRLKRKERCFDKKVRYHSRSRLAEKRPRVKGQFVRQVQTASIAIETDKPNS